MAETDHPQLYLVSPSDFDPEAFPRLLEQVLDAADFACLRLALASHDEDRIARAADAVRVITEARDVALVVDEHMSLAQRLGLDGVHLGDGARRVAKARKLLGADAIVGAYCAASRHDGLGAGEAGADYVSFGPVGGAALSDGTAADVALFQWWSEMIEVPVVAEGGLDDAALRAFAPVSDFLGLGEEIWGAQDPATAARQIQSLVQAG